jgi:Fe2+ transport system protein FeoA
MAATASQPIPLTQLARGDRVVVGTSRLGNDECAMLHAMGLHEGCEVTVCRTGHNCIVQIESTRLGISRRLAQEILAVPCECAASDPVDGSG